jgi:hypothetical protein
VEKDESKEKRQDRDKGEGKYLERRYGAGVAIVGSSDCGLV